MSAQIDPAILRRQADKLHKAKGESASILLSAATCIEQLTGKIEDLLEANYRERCALRQQISNVEVARDLWKRKAERLSRRLRKVLPEVG